MITIRPASPAIRPSCNAWLPSVADTWEEEISRRVIGSAPSCRSVARSCAVVLVKPPVMSAPLSPLIPCGYWLKSIDGTVISLPSSATAKC